MTVSDNSASVLDIAAITSKLRRFANERDWNQYHSPKNLAMALTVEAGELLEIFQWLTENQSREPSQQQMEQIRHEVADVMLYLIRLSDVLDINLDKALADKMALNEQRYPADKVKGSARKYTEYR